MTDKEFLMVLGKQISAIRKSKGFTQLNIGAVINMECSTISAIENGHQNPSLLTLKKFTDALGVSVIDFFQKL